MTTHRVRARLLYGSALLLVAAALIGCQSVTGPERVVQLLEVAPDKLPCVGVAEQECMQIRESGSTQWLYFYGEIEGFTFVAGNSYVLRVERTRVENPPADGSSFRWRLLEIVSQTPVT